MMPARYSVVILPILIIALPCRAGDPPAAKPRPIDEARAREEIARFDIQFGLRSEELEALESVRRAKLVAGLARAFDHPLVAERLGRILKSKLEARIRLAAAAGLGGYGEASAPTRQRAGKILLGVLSREPRGPVLPATMRALGRLRFREATPMLGRYLSKKNLRNEEREAALHAAADALGDMGDYEALRPLASAFRVFTDLNRVQSGRAKTNVDRLVGGHAKKSSSAAPVSAAPSLARIRKAIQRITGERFETPRDLDARMGELRKRLRERD